MNRDVTSLLTEPWYPVEGGMAAAMERALRHEIGPEHVLAGVRARAVGRRQDQDDVLFELEDGRWAVVHLAFQGHRSTDPRFPRTTLLDSRDAIRARVAKDAFDFGVT